MPKTTGRPPLPRWPLGPALALVLACSPAPGAAEGQPGQAPPNIVFVMVDDWGWTDAGCLGSDLYETPNVDRLAREGMRFTDAYSAGNVCSPTRAALMTGKYPARLGVTDWITGNEFPWAKLAVPDWTQYLDLDEVSLAEALGAAGYATAIVGKWHLGEEPHWPDKHGFDVNVGGAARGAPGSYFSPHGIPNLEDGPPGEYLTDREADEALAFLTEHREGPFFLYLSHYAVHTPLQAKPDLVQRYRQRAPHAQVHKNSVYAAMIDSVDQCLGRVLDKLEELGIDDRTAVFFTSDNGGVAFPVTRNDPLRAGKGSTYEGGVRVPLIVRWPGVAAAGSVCDEPVITPDFYPTLLEIAGAAGDPAHNRDVDGHSITALLDDPATTLGRDTIFWHYPHYHTGGATPFGAVRSGRWKLIELYEDGRLELYDLEADIGESRNLVAEHAAEAEALRQQLHAWLAEVGAQMPMENPGYDPERAGKNKRNPSGH